MADMCLAPILWPFLSYKYLTVLSAVVEIQVQQGNDAQSSFPIWCEDVRWQKSS